MEDRLARAMAMDAAQQGGGVDPGEVYTKEQVDTLLSGKVDKVPGKSLSTNDFTDTDKTNLTTALEKANEAAPQATTHTKTEVDTAMAAKLNTSDVDEDISSTSTNPVQNKAVQAPLAMLIDNGVKNLLNLDTSVIRNEYSGVTVTRAGNELTISSDSAQNIRSIEIRNLNLPINTPLIISGCPSDGGMDKYIVDAFNNGGYITGQTGDFGKGSSAITFTTMTDSYIRIRLAANFSFTNKVFRMMVCTAEDWAISHEFVPYAPTNRELYEMILALQNGGNS